MSPDQPPLELGPLSAWFAEGVRSEIAALEKEGGTQEYEVLSGRSIEGTSDSQAIFQFVIADGTRIPEDASGRLKTQTDEFAATVISQQGNYINLHVVGQASLPPNIPRAMLIIDDTALLRKLAEILQEISIKPSGFGPLAVQVFHPNLAKVGSAKLPDCPALRKDIGELSAVLEQACGSSITYIWGPPGTGKTFGIAHLIAALIESGERVLVTSHTHAAVDQAAYAAVRPEAGREGPLADHPAVRNGKVIRIGHTLDKKVASIQLNKVLETKAEEIQTELSGTENSARKLNQRRASYRAAISEWDKLNDIISKLNTEEERAKHLEDEQSKKESSINDIKDHINVRTVQVEKAQRAWFRRQAKTERARKILQDAETELQSLEEELSLGYRELEKRKEFLRDIKAIRVSQMSLCEKFPPRTNIEKELLEIAKELDPLEEKIRFLQDAISKLEAKIIDDAQVIFCTLTKCYTGKELEGQRFDAVIVDELSMALPPLVFLAAGRATERAILVGDFLQLPPIVRSDSPISNARLGTDTFHLAGVADDSKPSQNCSVLTRLTQQRRMLPEIADVARHLVYSQAGLELMDDLVALRKRKPIELDFLPSNPLVIVDTADLYCWSGKQPGSLSRFNFYSAVLAVELAAMIAAQILEPPSEEPPPIGIVAPYAAQRRLLSKLVNDMDLNRWVWPGTVHTFQGGEADIIIFDSVLDEPYWGARLCNPRSIDEVKRDLNVAVTRAKSKFLFIGSSEWLNRHAKPLCGLGQLWAFLKERADLVSATEFVELSFHEHVARQTNSSEGWKIPFREEGLVHEVLDEVCFFEFFENDISSASKSIFGLVPFFGEYRWPKIQPLLSGALARKVEVTLVTPPMSELENAANPEYVKKAIANLRDLGAIVVPASGLHGKDVVIDERIHYTGSLNWASHRGRNEIMHRTDSPTLAKLVLQYMQARYIRTASTYEDGTPRACPLCGWPTQVVNLRKQTRWDFQAMKIGCTNPKCEGYLRDINERAPFKEIPKCPQDGRTKYRRVRRGRGEIWECPKHPRDCPREKVVPGDPS